MLHCLYMFKESYKEGIGVDIEVGQEEVSELRARAQNESSSYETRIAASRKLIDFLKNELRGDPENISLKIDIAEAETYLAGLEQDMCNLS